MHELSVASELVDAAVREAAKHNARRIESVTCHVGLMQQIVPAILVDAFQMAATGTPAEGAALEVLTVAPHVNCRACGSDTEQTEWSFACPKCGSSDVTTTGGDELVLASVTLELDDES
jgi:hydrogenase nickel incorporation protein HypA/HybF